MADLSEIIAAVEAETEVTSSAITLLNQLADQVRSLSTDPAAIAALADQINSQADALAAAVSANTPAPPEEPPAEEPPADGTATEGTAEDGAPAGEPPVE
jgi:hypothetical protein